MAGATHVLRYQGVNFDATMLDTNDLSTVRGSSLALDAAAAIVEAALQETCSSVKKLTAAAGQGAFSFAGNPEPAVAEVLKALASAHTVAMDRWPWTLDVPLRHLTFMVDAVPVAAPGNVAAINAAKDHAEARNLSGQYRRWTFGTLPALGTSETFDRWDGVRPADTNVKVPKDKLRILDPAADEKLVEQEGPYDKVDMSASVAARRTYGRHARQNFYSNPEYASPCKASGLKFTDSFEGLVGRAPPGLPVSLANKMAVLHVDGNGFGKVRDALGDGEFDTQRGGCHRALLDATLDWFRDGGSNDPCFQIEEKSRKPGQLSSHACRLETLMWGGDDIDLVLPGWLAFAFAESFFNHSTKWRFKPPTGGAEMAVTHTMGIIICDRKTPIRLARQLAQQSVRLAKDATGRADCVTFDIFEGIAPPDDGLEAHRARYYGMQRPLDSHARGLADQYLAGQLALPPGDELKELREQICRFKDGNGLPRSKIYGVLKNVRDNCGGKFATALANTNAHELIASYFRRVVGADVNFSDFDMKYVAAPKEAFKELTAACAKAGIDPPLPQYRSRALDLVLATQFWDYADPFDGQLQPFGYKP